MTTARPGPTQEITDTARETFHRFLDRYEALRPDLYRYCRHLTRSPWDAEDLAQDTMARAFSTLACMYAPPENPRAWLFRVAVNLWIDRTRHARHEPRPAAAPGDASEPATTGDPRATREAAGTLIGRLSPQERAAVVLKDVLDLTLEEIAEALSTSVGAVKAALHRGRGKLVEPEAEAVAAPSRAVLDAFCDAFNARDLDRLTSLLLDTAAIEVVGVHMEYGPKAARTSTLTGMLLGGERLANSAEPLAAAVDPRVREHILPQPPRAELRFHRGEALMLLWYAHEDGEWVRAVNRLEVEGDGISRLRHYFFTPDFVAEVAGELGLPSRTNGYRYWGTT
jgi:RNA polymerase sigma-70 factor (ECF subfamily)